MLRKDAGRRVRAICPGDGERPHRQTKSSSHFIQGATMNIRKPLFAVALTALAGSALAAQPSHHTGGTGQDHRQQAQARSRQQGRQQERRQNKTSRRQEELIRRLTPHSNHHPPGARVQAGGYPVETLRRGILFCVAGAEPTCESCWSKTIPTPRPSSSRACARTDTPSTTPATAGRDCSWPPPRSSTRSCSTACCRWSTAWCCCRPCAAPAIPRPCCC